MSKRVLLDTNIIIHREGFSIQKHSIVQLFYWLDKLKYEKYIHYKTIEEINKYKVDFKKEVILQKINSYNRTDYPYNFNDTFLTIVRELDGKENDETDNILLWGIYNEYFDLLITEDRKIIKKAEKLGINYKVVSIDDFIDECDKENPELVKYKFKKVEPKKFGEIDLNDIFFDSLRNNYENFDIWYKKKIDELAYVNYDDEGKLRGFLYLKKEDENEDYSEITPIFKPLKRLKIGTFKVETTGYRLGERFLKIIFDNALNYNVKEIYVTMFDENEDVIILKELLEKWGFVYHGEKHHNNKSESVYVKKLNVYDKTKSVVWNFPNINIAVNKYYLPIKPEYHTQLFPDSILKTEGKMQFKDSEANRFALEKCYISFKSIDNLKIGDLLFIYRMGITPGRKAYEAVISSICIISELIKNTDNEKEILNFCKNRSVFTENELKKFSKQKINLIKMLYIKPLNEKVILKVLWDNKILTAPKGAIQNILITNENFNKILELGKTII